MWTLCVTELNGCWTHHPKLELSWIDVGDSNVRNASQSLSSGTILLRCFYYSTWTTKTTWPHRACFITHQRTPLVETPKPWCTTSSGVIISKSPLVHHCAFLTSISMKVLPLTIPLVYFFLLPWPSLVSNQDKEDGGMELPKVLSMEYIPLPTDEDESTTNVYLYSQTVVLSTSDKCC